MDKEALAYHRHMRKVATEAKTLSERLAHCDRCDAVLPVDQLQNANTFLFCKNTTDCLARKHHSDAVSRERDDLIARLEAVTGERDRLRQALADYGEHDAGCPRRYVQPMHSAGAKTEGEGTCACGLDDELRGGGEG